MTTDGRGLYVHIPFCKRKCNYCDFCSYADSIDLNLEPYVSALISEAEQYRRDKKIKIDTVYFGGGTPSLLPPAVLEHVLVRVSDIFDISGTAEVTLEANPATFDKDKLVAYKALGVNRISVGLQSIHENELKKLGRIHTPEQIYSSYKCIRDVGFDNVNLDLMYGIPEQTENSFASTLDAVIALEPEHVSAYGLIVEEGTPFYLERKTLSLPDEDTECAMYYMAAERLSCAGYRHYEISNYAKHGMESRHNLKYWRAEEYIGLGVSAYSYFEGKRYGNARTLSSYLSTQTPAESEVLTRKDEMYEYAMMRLRLIEGISLADYRSRFGADFTRGRESIIERFLSLGLLSVSEDSLSLTERGFYLSNTILAEIL